MCPQFESGRSHQTGTKTEIVAREGGFFFGFAEQNPVLFLGGDLKLLGRKADFLFFHFQVQAKDFEVKRLFSYQIVRFGYFPDRNGSFYPFFHWFKPRILPKQNTAHFLL
ncbi:MAG: hypothetical protein EOT05_00010 [Candidatus Microsaccharimonas sossegonensis]|uniref:Uncharacterized protein n=1 Tax=Candidatus Microsaccharimonas sossegonensis TaxID=2506948 RepID=A0A4Q0AG69_9BACT|nr:MAG: hypothetical protein EOT05_00010 [Candidatus Microsaccharimonas sossegonensis]